MEQFNFSTKGLKIYALLEHLLHEGKDLGIELKRVSEKLQYLKESVDSTDIKVALVGRFSDGKTSILAAMLGRKAENMKIGVDETSDELQTYVIDGMRHGVVFVDTPGLFGTKQKEIDGDNISVSETTEEFLSSAHIIIYVCDARTPIKNTHESLIIDILRKHKKLPVTIFVLNKMDDVCLLDDDEDFVEKEQIKKQWLIDGLKRAISLSDEEANNIHCVCIAADPDEKGLDFWLEQSNYNELSRIGKLRDEVQRLIDSTDEEHLHSANIEAIKKDLLFQLEDESEKQITPLENSIAGMQAVNNDVKNDIEAIQRNLSQVRIDLRKRFEAERQRLLANIDNATREDFSELLDNEFGKQNEDGFDFYILESHIDSIVEEALGSCKQLELKCQKDVELLQNKSNQFVDVINKLGGKIGNIKINKEIVKSGRDLIASGHKFKPWGASKLAAKMNKAIGAFGLLWEAWQWWREHKENEKFKELQSQLKEVVHDYFKELLIYIKDDNHFYELTPGFVELCKLLKTQAEEVMSYQEELTNMRIYIEKLQKLREVDIIDVEFEEL